MAETVADSDLVAAILHQARSGLAALVGRDGASVIDLATLSAAEIAALDAALGRGEVSARVAACGEVRLHETQFAGLWRVDHLGPGGTAVTARFIEITLAPTLLCTPREDAAAGLAALERRLGVGP
jgi:hydrogenase-1 operon protein HyaF